MMNQGNQEYLMARYERATVAGLAVFYAVGLIGHALPNWYQLMLTLTPYVLLVTALAGFLPFILEKRKKLLIWAGATFAITLFLEILGVATGLVFGAYSYGDTLGLQIMGAPILIGINWTLIILGALAISGRLIRHPIITPLIAALICVVFDYIMEPVAIALDYWSWDGDLIPLQNYLAWGLIALAMGLVFHKMKLQSNHLLPAAIVVIQALFFLALRFIVN